MKMFAGVMLFIINLIINLKMMNKTQNRNNRQAMYLKYTKSNLFSQDGIDNIHKITPKVTEKKIFSSVYKPQYKEKSAREQYMKQFWNKDIKDQKKASKPVKINLNLNANDIICRDIFSDCDAKEYKISKSKSFYLPRSGCNIDLSEKNTMSSRSRKIDQMNSDIFFTESNRPKKIGKAMYLSQLPSPPNEKARPLITFRNKASNDNNKAVNTIVYSKNPSRFDNRYTNTEPVLRRSATIAPKKKSFRKVNLCERDTNSHLNKVKDSIASTGVRTNSSNVESVNYNILMPTKPNSITPSLCTINCFFNEEKKKIIENYEINVSKEFPKANARELKNYFISEGLHIFNFEEKQNCVNSQIGKFTFKIRRSDIDKDYDNKINKIHKKVEKHQMVMRKMPLMFKIPLYVYRLIDI